jgi:fluoroacetyl-CoA thioesterase
MQPLSIGDTAEYEHVVAAADTAEHWGNELPVLATPVLLWLTEVTAMRVVADRLDVGEMTVGVSHDSSHVAPTPVGHPVTVTARLTEQRGRILVFEVEAADRDEVVLQGTHTRAVVDRARFATRIAAKSRCAA